MRLTSLPAITLTAAVVLSVACSSGNGNAQTTATVTATFEPPPPPPTQVVPPKPTATATTTATTITADNAGALVEIAAAQLDAPFGRLVWRADGQAIFVTTPQSVLAMTRGESALTSLLEVEDPARILDVSSIGLAAVLEGNHTITLRETGPDTIVKTLEVPETVTDAVFSPDGKVLAVTIADSITTQLWDVDTGAKVQDLTGFETAAPVYGVEFGPAGRSIIWVSRAHAQVQDLVTNQLGPVANEDDFIGGIEISPTEPVLATGAGPKLTLWDLESGDILDVFDLPEAVTALTYTPDGKLIFVSTSAGVTILNLPVLTPAGGLSGSMAAMATTTDGDALAVVDSEGRVAIYAP